MKVLMFSSDSHNPRLQKYAEVLDKLEIIDLSRSRGRFKRFWDGYRQARAMLASEKFDVITAQEIEHSFMAWRLSKKFGVPWQMQIHTDVFSPYFAKASFFNWARSIMAKILIKRASCIRVVSDRIKESIGRDGVSVLPIYTQATDTGSLINLKTKYPGYDSYFLMVCRLSNEKNIGLAVDALKDIIGKDYNPLLMIVGDGPERKVLEEKVLDGLEANVKFEGWQGDLSGFYGSADLLVVTSDYEGYGLSIIEALSAGLPVVMTDVGVAGELVKNGENGFVVPVGGKVELVNRILDFLSDDKLRIKLKEGAKGTRLPYASFNEYRDKLVNSWKTCQIKQK